MNTDGCECEIYLSAAHVNVYFGTIISYVDVRFPIAAETMVCAHSLCRSTYNANMPRIAY